jgi:tetratricopeptide (TPR) repeat protein
VRTQTLKPRPALRDFAPWVLLLAAAALKAANLAVYARRLPFLLHPTGDAELYLEWAQRIAAGLAGHEVYYRAPLYPYLLALLLKLGAGLWPAYVLQAVLGLATVWLAYRIGTGLYGRAAGLLAAAATAMAAPLLFFETKLLSAVLVVFLVTLGTWLVTFTAQPKKRWLWLMAGICFGLAGVAWPGALLPFGALCLWAALGRPAGRKALPLGIAGCLAVVAVVTIRNAAAGRDFVPVSANSGFTFYQGNNRLAAGTLAQPPEVFQFQHEGRYLTSIAEQERFERLYAESRLGRNVPWSRISGFWLGRAADWVVRNPGAWLVLLGRKLVLALSDYESPSDYNLQVETTETWPLKVAAVGFALLLALAAAGLAMSPDRQTWPLYAVLLGILAALLIFYVADRYRLPAYPALAVLAGAGLHKLWRAVRFRKLTALPVVVGLTALGLSLVAFNLPLLRGSELLRAGAYRNLAEVYESRAGDLGRAESGLKTAISLYERSLNPASLQEKTALAETRLMLARLYDRTGRADLAAEQLDLARALNTGLRLPTTVRSLVAAAKATLARCDTAAAVTMLERVLAADSSQHDAYLVLGGIYGTQQRHGLALELFTRAATRFPDDPVMLYNCALAALNAGDYPVALARAEQVLRLVPGHPLAKAVRDRACRRPGYN